MHISSSTGIHTSLDHRHFWTCCTRALGCFSHSLGCLSASQLQSGKQVVLSAQCWSPGVSFTSLFVLCPIEYAKRFLIQKKKIIGEAWHAWASMLLWLLLSNHNSYPTCIICASSQRWRHNCGQTSCGSVFRYQGIKVSIQKAWQKWIYVESCHRFMAFLVWYRAILYNTCWCNKTASFSFATITPQKQELFALFLELTCTYLIWTFFGIAFSVVTFSHRSALFIKKKCSGHRRK